MVQAGELTLLNSRSRCFTVTLSEYSDGQLANEVKHNSIEKVDGPSSGELMNVKLLTAAEGSSLDKRGRPVGPTLNRLMPFSKASCC